jgi:hypothetical protein
MLTGEGDQMATATEQTRAAVQDELTARAEDGATLAALLDHVDKKNRSRTLSDEQNEQLQLYCWALHKRQSSGLLWGEASVWGFLEEDIGG